MRWRLFNQAELDGRPIQVIRNNLYDLENERTSMRGISVSLFVRESLKGSQTMKFIEEFCSVFASGLVCCTARRAASY